MTIASGELALAADMLVSLTAAGALRLTDGGELTLSSGAVTVTANYHNIDVETGSSDDLDTLTAGTGVTTGFPVFIRPNHTDRTIVVKHGTGNIVCPGGLDIVLDDSSDQVLLMYDATLSKWLAHPVGELRVSGRQGGATNDWATSGTTDYVPGGANIQFGTFSITCTSGQAKASSSVTLPKAYAAGAPIVLATVKNNTFTDSDDVVVTANGNTGVPPISGITFTLYPTAGTTFSDTQAVIVYWLAIGPN